MFTRGEDPYRSLEVDISWKNYLTRLFTLNDGTVYNIRLLPNLHKPHKPYETYEFSRNAMNTRPLKRGISFAFVDGEFKILEFGTQVGRFIEQNPLLYNLYKGLGLRITARVMPGNYNDFEIEMVESDSFRVVSSPDDYNMVLEMYAKHNQDLTYTAKQRENYYKKNYGN